MDNEEVIRLLREIRDLQKQHVENYRDALQNQQLAIAIQQKAGRFQKISLSVLVIVVLALIAAVTMLPSH